MKKIILACAFTLPLVSFADNFNTSNSNQEFKQKIFEMKKEQILQRLNQSITCVENSSSMQDLKNCRPKRFSNN